MDVGTEVRESGTLKRTLYRHTRIGADPGDTGQRRETKRGAGREPHDQHGELAMLEYDGTCPKRKKENTGRLKEEVTKKARTWRNKRNENRRWRKDKDQPRR